VSTEVLEDAMSDTATDTHRGQDTAQISEEYLTQLKELATVKAGRSTGPSAAHWPSQRLAFVARTAKCMSIVVAGGTLSLCPDACHQQSSSPEGPQGRGFVHHCLNMPCQQSDRDRSLEDLSLGTD
jgi:hypothetical protein